MALYFNISSLRVPKHFGEWNYAFISDMETNKCKCHPVTSILKLLNGFSYTRDTYDLTLFYPHSLTFATFILCFRHTEQFLVLDFLSQVFTHAIYFVRYPKYAFQLASPILQIPFLFHKGLA